MNLDSEQEYIFFKHQHHNNLYTKYSTFTKFTYDVIFFNSTVVHLKNILQKKNLTP